MLLAPSKTRSARTVGYTATSAPEGPVIRNCPLCGGECYLRKGMSILLGPCRRKVMKPRIRCKQCGLQLQTSKTFRTLVKMWNKRVDVA